MDLNDNGNLIGVESSPPGAAPRKKSEDTPEGCRTLAKDDRDRADASDTEHMRQRLVGSAEAWTARADLLERIEGSRSAKAGRVAAPFGQEENDNG
ncbi:MAG TPA: hypothetical protein VF067_06280 [Sphingomicrobium sp.]